LSVLPSPHRLAFCAAISQRMLPSYNIYVREEGWGNPNVLVAALDEVWLILEGKIPNFIEIRQLIESCEEVCPNADDCRKSVWIMEAMFTTEAICGTLGYILEDTSLAAAKVAQTVRESLYAHIEFKMDNSGANWDNKSLKEQEKEVANHPLTIKEINKENEDFNCLIQSKFLDRELLKWLRTSFDNDGKSIHDLK